jgi:hypothetical protein
MEVFANRASGSVAPPSASVAGRASGLIERVSELFAWPDGQIDESPPRWYEARWLWLLLAALSALPFAVTALPPLGDLYSHIGRYHVMLEHGRSPFLDRYYEFSWGLIPNLGQDLPMALLGRWLGAERGGILLCALIPPFLILGMRALSIAVHGRVQPHILFALPFALSYTYLYGFVNYHTGIVVLIWAMAVWWRLRDQPAALRAGVFAGLSFVTWLCHLSAWGLLLCAVGVFELVEGIRRSGWRPWAVISPLLTVTLPMLIPLALMFGGRKEGMPLEALAPDFRLKLVWLAFPLRDEWKALDLASLALIGFAVLACVGARKLKLSPALAAYAALTFGLYWAIPTALMGGYYADLRLLPVAWIAGLSACRLADVPKWRNALAAVAVVLFALRIAVTANAWDERGDSLRADLEAIDRLPRGARIFALTPDRNCQSWPNNGLSHLPSLAIVRRDAYVNTEWDIPGQQLMRPIYARDLDFDVWASVTPRGTDCTGRDGAEVLASLPRDKFDYVWIFAVPLPATGRGWLEPIFQGPRGTLYAVRR